MPWGYIIFGVVAIAIVISAYFTGREDGFVAGKVHGGNETWNRAYDFGYKTAHQEIKNKAYRSNSRLNKLVGNGEVIPFRRRSAPRD